MMLFAIGIKHALAIIGAVDGIGGSLATKFGLIGTALAPAP
jgi:Flp pilus assembly pilin Flp